MVRIHVGGQMKLENDDFNEIAKVAVYMARSRGLFGFQFVDGKLTTGYTKDAECGIVIDDRDEMKDRVSIWLEPRDKWGARQLSDSEAIVYVENFLRDFANEGVLEIEDGD